MIDRRLISSLYSLALIEGEGIGTAYEYYVKRLVMSSWLKIRTHPGCLLVCGLPEKYGSSLDFVLLASELRLQLTVIDERPEALERFKSSITTAIEQGWFHDLEWKIESVENISDLGDSRGEFDLALSSEVIQRLGPEGQHGYQAQLADLASQIALFVPNADNKGHRDISGLPGLSCQDFMNLLGDSPVQMGYIDMPPFPPGITRTQEQREQAKHGSVENSAMRLLQYYARLERFLPDIIRRRYSHIVYALI